MIAVAAVLLAGCAGDSSYPSDAEVARHLIPYAYCTYGAVSRDQLHGCMNHVTEQEVLRLHTNSARYAVGDIQNCLADSGPFCKPWGYGNR